MAKYKRQKVKRYRRSFYSRGTRIKKGIGIVVLVLAVLGAAWLAAPHVLDWATHTWYTVVKNRDLEAESASRAAASSEAAASSAVQEAASSQPEPEQPKELDGKAITGGSWAAVDVSTLADDAAIRAAAQQLKAQGADYGLVTLKDADGSIHYASQVAAASGSIAGTTVDRPASRPFSGRRASSRRHSLRPLPTRCPAIPTAAWPCITAAPSSGWITSVPRPAASPGWTPAQHPLCSMWAT